MLIISLIGVIGVALAIPAPRQLLVHGPGSYDALDTRGSNWDGVHGEPTEEMERANRLKFAKRANDLINMIMDRRNKESDTNNGLSSQDPYGTGRRFVKDDVLTLRVAKPPARIIAGTPIQGGDPVSKRNANTDVDHVWIPDGKPPARVESVSLPAHDGRSLVKERDPPPGHAGKGGLRKDFLSIRQEESARSVNVNSGNKNWKKSTGKNWLRILGSDEKHLNKRNAGENNKAPAWIRITTREHDEKLRSLRDSQNNGREQDWSRKPVGDETSESRRQEHSDGEIDLGRQVRLIWSAVIYIRILLTLR